MMTPQRAMTHPDTAAIAVSLAAALVADTFAEMNLVLIVLWCIAMIADLLSGLWRTIVLEGWAHVSGDRFARGMAKKIAFTFFWIAAALSDALISVFPAVGSFGDHTPVTKAVLVAMLIKELASIARNAKLATGSNVPFELIMRGLDKANIGGQEPPVQRHYDTEALKQEVEMIRLAEGATDPHGGES